MIAGLPLAAWVLLFFAVGTGLTLELVAYRRAKRRDRGHSSPEEAARPADPIRGGPG